MNKSTQLKRSFGLTALFIYGLGDILGAGIYALIGKVAAAAGSFTWVSFVVALVIAMLTALSYAELTRRHPRSGGASYFIQVATGNKTAGFIVGWLLLCVSLVSMATLARAFVGYAQSFGWEISDPALILLFLGVLTMINIRGIAQASFANIVSTTIEVIGLIVVAIAGVYFLGKYQIDIQPRQETLSTMGVLQGAALAFYAFIGFEDLANVAEEVKNPERDLPIAIVGSLLVAGLFYVFIGWISTQLLAPEVLARSPNPLTEMVAQSGLQFPIRVFGVIALFAVANTCLLNFITGSRLLYGMGKESLVPEAFSRVHEKYATPYFSILAIVPIAFLLAALGKLSFLAGTTSILILLVFCSTCFSLLKIKNKDSDSSGFQVPKFIVWLGLIANTALIIFSERDSLTAAFGFLLIGAVFSWLMQAKIWMRFRFHHASS